MKLLFIILIITILLLLFIPIYIRIELKRKSGEDKIQLIVYILKGILKYKYEISYIDLIIKYYNDHTDEKKGKSNEMKKDKKIKLATKLLKKSKKPIDYKKVLKAIWGYLIKKIELKSINLKSTIGLGDAALTGILYGLIWSLIGTLTNIISQYKDINEINIENNPDFNNKICIIDFFCIIRLKIVHIIIASYRGVKVFIKGGEPNA